MKWIISLHITSWFDRAFCIRRKEYQGHPGFHGEIYHQQTGKQ